MDRTLAKDGELLKTTRGDRVRVELGDYYAIDVRGKYYITAKHVEPEALGRELSVRLPFEAVIDP